MISSPLIIKSNTFNANSSTSYVIGVNEESLVADKTLVSDDALYQNFIVNTTGLSVFLPVGTEGDRFYIKNDFDSTENLTVEPGSLVLIPGSTVHLIYTGSRWVEF